MIFQVKKAIFLRRIQQMNKCAVITGASRGIGAGIAEKLAQEKFNLALCARQEQCVGDLQCAELEAKYGIKAAYFRCDISDSDARKKTCAAIIERFGKVDLLVNNAGVAPKVRADILEMTEESYDFVMDINLKGSFFFTQLFARHFADQRSGTIVNIGSCSATVASVSRGEYCMAKAGVGMATKLWAVRMAEFGVNVYEIRPGIIETDMTSTVKGKYDKLISEGLTLQPRWGYPEDIAKVVASLARGDFAYSTGQVINIDGGMNIQKL